MTADVVELYPSIPLSESLDILKKQCDKYPNKKVSTDYIGKMADFVLRLLSANPTKLSNTLKIRRLSNNFFEFDSKFYKQTSGTTIGTKFALRYPCGFMDHFETEFLKTQDIKYRSQKRFIADILLYGQKVKRPYENSLMTSINLHPNLKFTYEKSKVKISFLGVVMKMKEGRIITDLYCKPVDGHQYLYYHSCHADHIKMSIIFIQHPN